MGFTTVIETFYIIYYFDVMYTSKIEEKKIDSSAYASVLEKC